MNTIETKKTTYEYEVRSPGDAEQFTVSVDENGGYISFNQDLSFSGTIKETAKYMRSFADALIKVAGKLEGIK